jgi:hypothetical protein
LDGPAVGLGPPWPSAEPPAAYPEPEQRLGFTTWQEARKVQRMLLNTRIDLAGPPIIFILSGVGI